MDKKILLALTFFLLIVSVSAQSYNRAGASFTSYGSTYNSDLQRYYSAEGRLQTYYPVLADRESCTARQDLLLQVAPFGCQPAVVRSDLLAEQNVPVFCQLDAIRVNPFVEIKEIRNIRFNGDYPAEVAGVGFHPAKAGLRTRDSLLGNPVMNDIGYVVVVLKKNPDESKLPDLVNFTLSARLDYYADNALGVGKAEFLLKETNDDDWEVERNRQSFFKGQYFMRLEQVDPNSALVSIYHGDVRITTTRLQKGQPSQEVYLPGSYCQTALRLYYDGFAGASALARIEVNEDEFDVYEGSRFLDNKCVVRAINEEDYSLDVSCGNERFVLQIGNFLLKAGDEVLYEDKQCVIQSVDNVKQEYTILCDGKTEKVFYDKVSPVNAENVLVDNAISDESRAYYLEALNYYEQVADDYPNEKGIEYEGIDGNYYGEKALLEAIYLAQDFGQYKTKARLITKFLDLYPRSDSAETLSREFNRLYQKNYEGAGTVVDVDSGFHSIRLKDIVPSKSESKAIFNYGQQRLSIEDNGNYSIGDISIGVNILDSDRVGVVWACGDDDGRATLSLNERGTGNILVCGSNLELSDIELEDYARIRVVPEVRTRGETNFTVGVGIEKRAIKLNPEKSQEKINKLNETIAKWDSVSNNLGEFIKGMKAACFATSGVLTAKNFLTGLSGASLARQEVMRGDNGWTERCNELVAQGDYPTLTACYNAKSSEINRDVTNYAKAIEMTNDAISDVEAEHKTTSSGIFGGTNVDTSGAAKDFIEEKLLAEYGDEDILVDGQTKKVRDVVRTSTYDNSEASYTELRGMYTSLLIRDGKAGAVSDNVKLQAEDNIQDIASRIDLYRRETETKNDLSSYLNEIGSSVPVAGYGDEFSIGGEYYGAKYKQGTFGTSEISDGTPVQPITFDNKPYLLALSESSSGSYIISNVYGLEQTGSGYHAVLATTEQSDKITGRLNRFIKVDSNSYNNVYKDPEVQYYETEPYKGLPALVPIDSSQGWYVATKQTLPGLGNIKAFESNGRPVSFWLCNVGSNGRAEFLRGIGDDICRQFNLETGQPLDKFPGLSEQRTRSLLDKAVRALNDASVQRSQGKATSNVRIDGESFKVGSPAGNIPGTQCQDFMSPEECLLLFNVCDPVICPSSRCDLGGTYPVADVVQTGVVGSALLCLPNIREGVAVPVCLTGIKAGIDGYLSILKSHQQCLQESVETGRNVGICDLVTSVYACEFFWRQAAPVANVALPKLVEFAYGQSGSRGGGEYLTVQSAWDNAQQSVNFFTQTYAVNSIEAFRVRSIEEAGTSFCRAFVSANGPKSFETLIEPDSPAQFHAWFSAIPFTDATVPATAQYKVFYHIYSGNDQGVAFNVYLKDPPQSSYYFSTPTIQVASGFIGRGEFATETRDFTAPEGYKQLCVRINDKEECGFKQVSTSFAINYARDSVVADEIERTDINSESQCISGGQNLGALFNPNLQEAGQELLDPAVYNRGIVRICATSNPGLSTEPARFVDVGYCGDQKIRCWLDKESVDNAITNNNKGVRNQTLSDLTTTQKNVLINQGEIYTDGETNSFFDDIENYLRRIRGAENDANVKDIAMKAVVLIGEVRPKLFLNMDFAEISLYQARINAVAAQKLKKDVKVPESVKGDTETNGPVDSGTTNQPENQSETNTQDTTQPVYTLNESYVLTKQASYAILVDGQKTKIYLKNVGSTTLIYYEGVESNIGGTRRESVDGRVVSSLNFKLIDNLEAQFPEGLPEGLAQLREDLNFRKIDGFNLIN